MIFIPISMYYLIVPPLFLRNGDLADSNIRHNFNRIRWDKAQVQQLDGIYQKAPIHVSCNSSQGREIEVSAKPFWQLLNA